MLGPRGVSQCYSLKVRIKQINRYTEIGYKLQVIESVF